jgi:hypothetical protein
VKKGVSQKIESFLELVERKWFVFPSIIFLWITYSLFSLLNAGFVSDDAYNSQIKGILIQGKMSLFARTMEEIIGWTTGAGRFFPLSIYHFSVYNFCDDMLFSKILTLGIVGAGVVVFSLFVSNLAASRSVGLLAGLTMSLFFQFRLWHDPILAFTFLLPILFLELISALYFFEKYLTDRKVSNLILCSFFFLCALMTYEIAYPFCVLFVALAWKRSGSIKSAFKDGLVPFLFGLFFFAMFFVLRSPLSPFVKAGQDRVSTYPAADLHLDLTSVLSTFAIQTVSGLPLSYFFFGKQPPLESLLFGVDLLVLLPITLLFYGLLQKIRRENSLKVIPFAIFFGMFFLFLPALVISVSGHQGEIIDLGYGYGYLSVYIQYFGTCLLLLALGIGLTVKLPKSIFKFWALTASILFLATTSTNMGQNRKVVTESNATFKYPRLMIEAALNSGIADQIPDGSLIIRHMRFASDYTWLYTANTGKTFEFCDPGSPKEFSDCVLKYLKKSNPDAIKTAAKAGFDIQDVSGINVWSNSYTFDRERGAWGQFVLGKVEKIYIGHENSPYVVQLSTSKPQLYDLRRNRVEVLKAEERPINFLNVIEEESRHIPRPTEFDVSRYSISDIISVWGKEFLPNEGPYPNSHHWAGNTNELLIFNFMETSQVVKLSMSLVSPTPDPSKLKIVFQKSEEILELSQTPIFYERKITLVPGQNLIQFLSDGKTLLKGDPRKIVFGVDDFKIIQEESPTK